MTELSRNTSYNCLADHISTLLSLTARIEGMFQALTHISNEIDSTSPLWNAAIALQDELFDRHEDVICELGEMELTFFKLRRGGQS